MNQPNDCPRFISEVAHERVVGELNRRIEQMTEQVAALHSFHQTQSQKELTVSLAQSKSRGDTLRAELTLTTQTRDRLAADVARLKEARDQLTNDVWRTKKERDEFEAAWRQALAEKHRLLALLGQVDALLRKGGAA